MSFDLSDINQYEDKVTEAEKIFGKLDILVNAAGVHTENVDFFTVTDKEYDRVTNINIKAVFFLSQVVSSYFIKNEIHGHILFISSSRGNEPAWSPYGISKWGLNGLTKGLAMKLLPYGIIVNAIAPGVVATELLGYNEGETIYSEENSLNRMAVPEEIAVYAKYLVSDLGNMVVGETINISGGRGIFTIK